ncbi:hypothetical protein [Tenacibaculum finnmarkense]|uniref:hypothetical protein n=1 Tax=Tenacibaculum finnmarkense TaxID=2781243 RepID=UPI001EFA2BAB|nr:hypothetical protein [Tenacibaculum finnmarkense]MCG8226405.1 hypothetical protein [Tenacibaculum finnmarkense genomovar finnmarkense]
MKTTDFKITTRKTGAGHFTVTIFDNKKWKEKGSFETTDASLVDDISELDNGFENELIKHETFEEVIEDCLNQIS